MGCAYFITTILFIYFLPSFFVYFFPSFFLYFLPSFLYIPVYRCSCFDYTSFIPCQLLFYFILLLHLGFFLFFHSCCLKCFQLFLLIICYNLNHQVGAVTFHLPPNKCETNLHNVCACFCSQLVYCCDSISFFTRITRCFALVFKINKN